jgi:hypothetical protein
MGSGTVVVGTMLLELLIGHADVGGLEGALPTAEALQLFIHGIELEEMHFHMASHKHKTHLSVGKVLLLLVAGSKTTV